ncbi:MAG: hypothetical protein ACJ8CB_18160 [Ktedonobacteraceae bacterium]
MQVYFHHLHTPQTGSAAVDYLEFVYVDHSILTVNLRRSGFRYTPKHNVLKLFLNYCPSWDARLGRPNRRSITVFTT